MTKFAFSANVNTKTTVIDLFLIPVKPTYSPYWYLYVLVFYYLIFYWLIQSDMADKMWLLISFVISAVGSMFLLFQNFGEWFSLGHAIKNFVFFSLGIYISKTDYTVLLSKISFIVTFIGTIISAVYSITFGVNLFSVPFVGIIAAAIITIFIINLFKKIQALSNAKIFTLCGKYSLEIYLTHCFITAANRIILIKLGITMFGVNVLVNFIMATFIPILCAYILKKIKLHKYIFRPFSVIEECKDLKTV